MVDPETNEILGVVSEYLSAHFYSGPLPTPEMLAEYERVLPGLGRRIVERWDQEAEHRQSLEKTIVRSRIVIQKRGQLIGALISFVVLAAGVVFVATGKSTAGLVALLAPLAILAGTFVYGELRSRRLGG